MKVSENMSIKKWLDKNTTSLEGKTVAISGSTGGLGRELCIHLAALGASLVLLDRNIVKSHALADELRSTYKGILISYITVDMTDIDAVRSAADQLSLMPIDYLILNAGAYSIPRCRLSCGYDNVFPFLYVGSNIKRGNVDAVSRKHLVHRITPALIFRGKGQKGVGIDASTVNVAFEKTKAQYV